MSSDGAKALVAKVMSDHDFAKELNLAKSAADFQAVAGKLGYDVTQEEFKDAFDAARNELPPKGELNDVQMEQVAGGLSIVGVDYAFTATQTARS